MTILDPSAGYFILINTFAVEPYDLVKVHVAEREA
jgi:hypothetical protein